MTYSYATERKIRIITEKLGEQWRDQYPNKSIDAIYNDLVGDTRKNLFCKIDSDVKDKLDAMTEFHKTGMAEFVEQLVKSAWKRHIDLQAETETQMLEEFTR